MMDFYDLLTEDEERPLLITEDRVFSRGEARELASGCARVLYHEGVKEGDLVLIHTELAVNLELGRLACAFLGATFITSGVILRGWAPALSMERHRPSYLITDKHFGPEYFGPKTYPNPSSDFIMFRKLSSGSTGPPKEFLIRRSLVFKKLEDDIRHGLCEADDCRMYLHAANDTAAISHDPVWLFAGIPANTSYAVFGGQRSAAAVIEFIERTRLCTHIILLWGPKTGTWPSQFVKDFADAATPDSLRGIRLVTTSPGEVCQAIESKLPNGLVLSSYGMKESAVKLFSSPTDPPVKRHHAVGKSEKAVNFRLDNTEMLIRADCIAKEVSGRTDSLFDNGWYRTGDWFEFDSDGYLAWGGRLTPRLW